MKDDTPAPMDPALLAMIERMVDARVDARLAGFSAQVEDALARLRAPEGSPRDQASIMVFSCDFDRLISAFIVATAPNEWPTPMICSSFCSSRKRSKSSAMASHVQSMNPSGASAAP